MVVMEGSEARASSSWYENAASPSQPSQPAAEPASNAGHQVRFANNIEGDPHEVKGLKAVGAS